MYLIKRMSMNIIDDRDECLVGEVEEVEVKRCLIRESVAKCYEHSQMTKNNLIDVGN